MKILKLIIGWAFIVNAQSSFSQEYSMANLDKSLLENANAVIRKNEITFNVMDTSKANFTHHLVITILNKNGDHFAKLFDYYDKFDRISDLKGKIFDGSGKLIRKMKESEFIDHSAVDDYSLFSDARVKYCIPMINNYPYTVEYEISETYNGLLNYPAWHPQYDYDIAVEHSSYTLSVPESFKIQFKSFNYNDKPIISTDQKNSVYFFELKELHAVDYEELSVGIHDFVPNVYIIPEFFKMENFTGSNKSWQSFGYWDQKLNEQENKLSEKTMSDLAEIKTKATDRNDLIKRVYEYMQSKTRYVSIQLGIGGWKPIDASLVDKYGYGDCKALSNYMKTLLQQVGIEACYTIVRAGKEENDIYTDQTFNQFNHAIVCVPNAKDTLWLECTNQMIPFGFLGDFTDDRHVLMITPEGGKIVKTPRYSPEENKLNRKTNLQLDMNGNATGIIHTSYRGLQFDNKFGVVHYLTPDKQKEILYKEISIPSTITNFKFEEHKDRIPSINESIDLTFTKYAVTMGNRIMLPLNAVNRESALSKMTKERKSKFRLRMAYFDSDTVIYQLPEGYSIEFVPKSSELKSEFGEYAYTVIASPEKSTITYIRTLKMNDGIFPPEKYKDFVAFHNEISKMDNIKVSLIKI